MCMDACTGRSSSWHRPGRSIPLAEAGDRLWCLSYRGEERRMVSGKIEREAEQDKRGGGKEVPVCE